MRILFLSASAQMGGAEASLLELVTVLKTVRADWDLKILVPAQGPLVSKLLTAGASVEAIEMPKAVSLLGDCYLSNAAHYGRFLLHSVKASLDTASYFLKLRRRLRQLQPDLVHTNGLKMHLLGAASAPLRTPVIWHIHDYLSARPVITPLLRFVKYRCAAAITVSDHVRQDLSMVLGLKSASRTIYSSIDDVRFSSEGSKLDLEKLSGRQAVSDDVIRIGLVGTFALWKGHRTFMEAMAKLPVSSRIHGYIIGGPLYSTAASQYSLVDLKQLARTLGIEDRLSFIGFVTNPEAAYRSLDIVVHASTRPEPFGLSVVEAMACQRAVIASDLGGVGEIIRRGGAIGFQPGSSAELAERIIELSSSRGQREKLGRLGRCVARSICDRERLGREFTEVYESVRRAA